MDTLRRLEIAWSWLLRRWWPPAKHHPGLSCAECALLLEEYRTGRILPSRTARITTVGENCWVTFTDDY